MYIVTGGAGFIGSNIVAGLNQQGIKDIIVVDDLTQGQKFINLSDLDIADYLDKDDFLALIKKRDDLGCDITACFHQGACSETTEWDGRFMMANNYEYSKALFHYCQDRGVPLMYASSAAVYGASSHFEPISDNEKPLNVYGYSKLQFDNYVRRHQKQLSSPVVGFRYFNVYGPREQHKGTMSSVAYHFNQQVQKGETIKLFEGTDGYSDGEQRRDFVSIDDVVAVNLWFAEQRGKSGIYNVGTGQSQSFNDVANAVIAWHQRGEINYIPFPEHLVGRYQSFTQADISALRAAGYQKPFATVEEGVKRYLDWMSER